MMRGRKGEERDEEKEREANDATWLFGSAFQLE